MTELITHLLIVLLPLVITNCSHMLIVKYRLFNYLNIPIWELGFGKNKTWRGLLFVPAFNGLSVYLITHLNHIELNHSILLGTLLGFIYVLSELPNSFIKRRMGIKAGENSSKFNNLFYVLDKTDSSFGVTFTYFIISGITFKMAVVIFLINSSVHTILAFILFKLKIKSGF